MTEPLGEATVLITGDKSGLSQTVADAKREVDGLGTATKQNADKAKDLYDDLGTYFETVRFNAAKAKAESRGLGNIMGRLGNSATKAQAAFSKIIIPVAVATGIATLITRFIQLRAEAAKFREDLRGIGSEASAQLAKAQQQAAGLTDVQKTIIQINEEASAQVGQIISRTQQQIEANGNLFKSLLTGFSPADAQREAEKAIDAIYASQRERTKVVLEQQKQDEKKAEEIKQAELAAAREKEIGKSLDRINEMARDAEIDLLPDADKIGANLDKAIDSVLAPLEGSGILDDADVQAAVDRYIKFLQEKARLDKLALEELDAETTKTELERAEKTAKAAADAYEREMSAAIDRLKSKMGPVFGDTNQLAAAIDRAANTIYGTRGGR